MANVLTYNGETINNLNLRSVDTVSEYTLGDTQRPRNRVTLMFDGTIGRDATPGDASEFTVNIDQVRRNLSKPRNDLLLTLEGEELFNITAPDDANGPKPRDINITEIAGTSYALVSGTIEMVIAECGYSVETPESIDSNIVSHSYSVTHTTDDLFLTTRNITGRIVLRQGVTIAPDNVNPLSNSRDDNPDLLRSLVTPTLPQGFKRESATFIVSDDGLMLDYDIRDVETPIVPPTPALRATGTIGFSVQNNYQWFTNMQIELEGPKNTSKSDMILLLFRIVESKMKLRNNGESLIQSSQVVSSLYSNKVAMQVVTKSVKINQDNNLAPVQGFARTFEQMIGSESGRAIDIGPYGTATIKAAKLKFFDPCVTDMTSETNSAATVYQGFRDGKNNQSRGPKISIAQMPAKSFSIKPDSNSVIDKTGISESERNRDYNFYEENITTEAVNGILSLPATSKDGQSVNYQTHAPFVRIRQEGRASRNSLTPDVPTPKTSGGREVKSQTVINHAPKILPDGKTFSYSTSWIYIIEAPISSSKYVQSDSRFTYINTFDNPTEIPFNVVSLPVSESEQPVEPFDKTA